MDAERYSDSESKKILAVGSKTIHSYESNREEDALPRKRHETANRFRALFKIRNTTYAHDTTRKSISTAYIERREQSSMMT